ncbi:hypothetical protein GPK34_00055 [Secundilactobacillus kimchicus]|uniref:hypothetical protein n=1 Tax=Secundilactobacillus kimchicus TaxID=528209 RepID=UPI001C0213D0|nr:hypothetical protein [Secundilactobacillus kimchicus]MBT9670428.1 hypothetical protein [Secundilactobacillus kimchicus]
MTDLIEKGLAELFKQAFQEGVQEGRKQSVVDTRLATRKELAAEMLRMSPTTADEHYLYEPDFPYVQQGTKRMYYLPAVHEWLMNHQEHNN